MNASLPFYVYPVQYRKNDPIRYVQIRDADHNIVMVSASYGEHSGAPVDGAEKLAIAEALVGAINATRAE